MEYRPNTKRATGQRHKNEGPNPNHLMLPPHTRVAKFVRPIAHTGPVITANLSPVAQKAATKYATRANSQPSSAGRVKR